MLRVFLVFAALAYASTAPPSGGVLQALRPIQLGQFSDVQQRNRANVQDDDSETVDNMGAGYSYFKKQQVDVQPFSRASSPVLQQDLSDYAGSSALNPQQSQTQVSRNGNSQFLQEALLQQQQQQTFPRFIQQQPQQEQQQQQFSFDQIQQGSFQPAMTQQQRNIFGQVAPQDVQTWSPQQQQQQILIGPTNLNRQNQNFGSLIDQQQNLGISAFPQQMWNNQNNQASLTSNLVNRGQQQLASPQVLQMFTGQKQGAQSAPIGRSVAGW